MISHSLWVLSTNTVSGICLVALSCSVLAAVQPAYGTGACSVVCQNGLECRPKDSNLIVILSSPPSLLGLQWNAKLLLIIWWRKIIYCNCNEKENKINKNPGIAVQDRSCLKPVERVWHGPSKDFNSRLNKLWWQLSVLNRNTHGTDIQYTSLVFVWEHHLFFKTKKHMDQNLLISPVYSTKSSQIWSYYLEKLLPGICCFN